MKTKLFFLVITISVAGCTIDNYTKPDLTLSGKIIDAQTNELVPSSGANAGTIIKLYEGNSTQPLLYNTFPDGTFKNSRVFPATYRIAAEGAFNMMEDTITKKITQDMQIEIKVVPLVRLKLTLLNFNGTSAEVKITYKKVNTQQRLTMLGVIWSTYKYPNATVFPEGDIILDDVTAADLTSGDTTYTITGLTAQTKYYIRAIALTDNPGNYYNYSIQVELPNK